jgi:hypothetical protein
VRRRREGVRKRMERKEGEGVSLLLPSFLSILLTTSLLLPFHPPH